MTTGDLLVPAAGGLRVMTLNLWCDEDERRARHVLAGRLAARLGVDVLLVQEVADAAREETLDVVAAESGLSVVSMSPRVHGGVSTAVLSNLPGEAAPSLRYTVPESSYDQLAAAAFVTTRAGRRVLVVSAHLIWGGLLEHRRVLQACALDAAVSGLLGSADDAAVLAGDMNALPSSATLGFLTGLVPWEGRTGQWTDAFAKAGRGSGVTSSGANVWARTTGSRHGFLDTALLPERRIDYVLVRGYAHGRPFTPLRCFGVSPDLFAGLFPSASFPPSDHDAVVADLWDPPAAGV